MNYPLCLLFVTLNKLCEANLKKIGKQRRSRQRFKASIPTFNESNVSNKSFGHTSSLSFHPVEKMEKKKEHGASNDLLHYIRELIEAFLNQG